MWILFVIIVIVIIVAIANSSKGNVKTPQNNSWFEENERKHRNYHDSLFEQYLEEYKDLTLEDIKWKIKWGKKDSYDDYTDDDKMRFRALKTIQERIRTDNFRNFFMNRQYLTVGNS
jgi:hypothetical protein